MALTRHGHHIPGSEAETSLPAQVANCGGPGLCLQCNQDCDLYREPPVEEKETKAPTIVGYPSPYANIFQCLTCHILLTNAAVRCPVCELKKELEDGS